MSLVTRNSSAWCPLIFKIFSTVLVSRSPHNSFYNIMKGDYFLPALLYMTCWILCWCYFSNTQVHNGLPDRPEDRHAAYTAVIQPLFPQGRRGTVRILVRMGNQTRHGRNCLHQVLQVNYQVKTCHGKTSNFWTRLAFWTIIFESVSLTQNWNAHVLNPTLNRLCHLRSERMAFLWFSYDKWVWMRPVGWSSLSGQFFTK